MTPFSCLTPKNWQYAYQFW